MNCIDVLYAKVSAELTISREQYEESLIGWDIEPINVRGKDIGVVMSKEHEIHVCLERKDAIAYGRSIIRKYLDERLKKHGCLTTIALKKNTADARFLERLGFKKTGEDETFFSYRIDSPKLKGKSCHQ